MALRYLIIFIFALSVLRDAHAATSADKKKLYGKVTDKITGQGLPGVTAYIPDLKTGGVTDINGKFEINNLPAKKLVVQFSLVGYKNSIITVDLAVSDSVNPVLEESVKEINTIVVTGSASAVEKNRNPAPITLVHRSAVLENSGSNIIDALATQPGISQITTGSGISKPVIRGLGYNRVVVVNDGVRQEGQQWGDEHGIEIDEYGVNDIEILKGPASLMYGSDAMAGVINMVTAPTLSEGKIASEFLSEYQSNNGLFGYSVNTKGNLKGFIWDGRFSSREAHSYKNKDDGYVYNSGFSERSAQTTLGLNRSWGYSHLSVSYYHLQPSITEGERDDQGRFVKPVFVNDSNTVMVPATDSEMKSYSQNIPYQKIDHYKVVLNNSVIIKQGTLKSTFGYQLNERKEFAEISTPDQYGLYFRLSTFNYEAKYHFPEFKKINVTSGINGMLQQSENKGTEFLVPAYSLADGGIFAIGNRNFNKIDVSAGIRYDMRSINGEDLFIDSSGNAVNAESSIEQRFKKFTSDYSGLTGSAGMAWNFSPVYYAKANYSFGFRAPNIAELGANGEHEGTARYEVGNPLLKAERSSQMDVSFGINTDHLSVELDAFLNNISNFIFLSKVSNGAGEDSLIGGNPVFFYSSGNAVLKGGELIVDLHPHPFDWLHFENSISLVDAQQKDQPDSTRYLPFTPPVKITSEIRLSKKKTGKLLLNSFIKAGAEIYLAQNKIYSAFNTETTTPGYTVLHAGLGTDLKFGQQKISFIFNVSNLGDEVFQSHLSRLKYADENPLTGRTGIFNPGRSYNLKITVPLEFSKKQG